MAAAAPAGAASAELVIGWCIFGLLLLAILAFCWIYVRKYQSQRESEVVSTITAIFSLAIALITSALLPVDIFLVSYMKNQNGTFKHFCSENSFMHIWVRLYNPGDRILLIEENLLWAINQIYFLFCSAFVPLNVPNNKNSTEWEKVKFLFEELGSSHGLAALSFSISSLTLVGMLAAITYTAYGMSALPLNLIKGTRSAAYERLENTEDIEEVEQHIQTIKSKSKDGRPLPARDKRALKQFEERLRTLRKRERHLEFIENSWWTKFCGALRPLKIIWGIFFILVALLFIISLFLSNLDKALHSAGIDSGFIIFGANLSNPLNMLLPVLQTVFPLDYVLITIIIMYFIFTSMAGIRNIGIWFFWVRLYKIRRGRTRPQALLFLCMILLLIVLHTSYMIYSLAPQYVMYGSQNYLIELALAVILNMNARYTGTLEYSGLSNGKSDKLNTGIPRFIALHSWSLVLVNNLLDKFLIVHFKKETISLLSFICFIDQCTVTRTYLFLHKFWFFSAAYYFGNWAFLGVFLIGLIVSCCKGKKSVIEGVDEDDSDISDDEPSVYSV
ncbi:probable lysosomal cobalamin transporter [Leptonychotes weddellii]|uniref:Probable lysosomal cobalamin transporter n=1 Tax=Leptonychotes weddellii TaxID=9713 RepID=A0A7F8QGJ1_LEPWE|nr:probable lysosomal cobalamin transporter [Leptonychotes weddellii]